MRTIRLSPTSMNTFKKCPEKYRIGYVLGWRTLEETEIQRMGNRWHLGREILERPVGSICPLCGGDAALVGGDCPVCVNKGVMPDFDSRIERMVSWLDAVYKYIPDGTDMVEMAVERAKLVASLFGWAWQRSQATEYDVDVLATEIPYDLPVRHPVSCRPLRNVRRVGRIDRLLLINQRTFAIGESKSTSSSVDPDSTFWDRLKMNIQANEYINAARDLQIRGDLIQYGIEPDSEPISHVLFDAWHRPTIRPKKLTQKDSADFVDSGEYCGQTFEVSPEDEAPSSPVLVDGVRAETEPGKKEGTFALRETPDMFQARLFSDIRERPEFYFGQQLVAKTNLDLDTHDWQRYNILTMIRAMTKNGAWYRDESQCEATYKCPYCSICYSKPQIQDNDPVPPGYRCKFTDAELEED